MNLDAQPNSQAEATRENPLPHFGPIPRSSFVLPPEILHLICSYFALPPVQDYPGFQPWQFKEYKKLRKQNSDSLQALKSLRETCHAFAMAANPFLFHTLMVDLTRSSSNKLFLMSAEPEPHLARLPHIFQYFRCLCVNLDCWSEGAACNESGLKRFVEVTADSDLESEAKEHRLRTGSYKQMWDDCPNIMDKEVRERFQTTLRALDELLTEWHPTRPFNLPASDFCNPRRGPGYRHRGNPESFFEGHRLYNKYFLDQRRLTNKASESLFLLRLKAAVRKMPRLHNLVLCDSRLLAKGTFEKPALRRRGFADSQGYARFFSLPHPWDRFARGNAELPLQVAQLLVLIPVALYEARVRLRNFHLFTFPPQEFLSRNNVQLSPLLLQKACKSLETFSIRDPSLQSVAQDDFKEHEDVHNSSLNMYNSGSHPQIPIVGSTFTRNYFLAILSKPNLRNLRLDSIAVCSIAGLPGPLPASTEHLFADTPMSDTTPHHTYSLELNNVSVTSEQLERFIGVLEPNLRELKMSHIHLHTGNFSKVLVLLRQLISEMPGCKVSLEDWSACDLLGPLIPVPEAPYYILSTSRAEKYVTGGDAEAKPEDLLDLHYWPKP